MGKVADYTHYAAIGAVLTVLVVGVIVAVLYFGSTAYCDANPDIPECAASIKYREENPIGSTPKPSPSTSPRHSSEVIDLTSPSPQQTQR
jgi:hypothetical protein